MAGRIFGTGTKDYGRHNSLPDGSCIRTKFLVLLFIPLWPLKSHRVRYESQKHLVRITPVPLCWPQVIGFLTVGYVMLGIALFLFSMVLMAVLSLMVQVL